MRAHLKSLGCRLNEAELHAWQLELAQHGIALGELEEADILIINSCAVTQEAVRKSKQWLRRARKHNPQAKLVLTGCYASLPEGQQDLEADLLISNADKEQLVPLIKQAWHIPELPPVEVPLLPENKQRAFIKVQDGCRYRCTYCIVTLARGEEKSRPLAHIIKQIQALEAQGIQEIVLTGVHLGGYGSDLGTDLKALVQAVLEQTQMARIRLGSLEPWDIPAGFWELWSDQRMMPHLHLPMQSGSDTVLRRMARRCRRQQFIELAEQARAAIPDLNITTDIIVGFPQETEAEWQQTLDFVQQVGFGHLHIFNYSPRAGTKAARLPALPAEIKKQRRLQLHQIAAELKQQALQAQIGKRWPVLTEGQQSGYTPNYFKVHLPPHTPPNRIITYQIRAHDGQALIPNLF